MAMNESLNDSQLYLRIAIEDDKKAFEVIFRRYYAHLCIFASHLLNNTSVSEDIVQDIFYRLWKDRKKIKIRTSLRNYLFTNTKNSCIDFVRHAKVMNEYVSSQRRVSQEEEPSNVFDIRKRLGDTLDKLQDGTKKMFIMNRFSGNTYKEIAQKRNVSEKTVEAHISKVLKLLRIEFKEFLTQK